MEKFGFIIKKIFMMFTCIDKTGEKNKLIKYASVPNVFDSKQKRGDGRLAITFLAHLLIRRCLYVYLY